jgi:hypothetical protein
MAIQPSPMEEGSMAEEVEGREVVTRTSAVEVVDQAMVGWAVARAGGGRRHRHVLEKPFGSFL